MNSISKLKRVAALGLLIGGAAAANASPQTWTFENVTFDDGATLSGSFLYNASTDDVLSYSITDTADAVNGYPALTYNGADSAVYAGVTSSPAPIAVSYYGSNELFVGFDDGSSALLVDFASALTNAGGTVQLLLGNINSDVTQGSFETNENTYLTRYMTSGEVTTTPPAAVPEPASLALCGVAGLALVGARRRKRG